MNALLIALFIALGLVVLFIGVALFRWLWNTTMPDVFGLKQITFWQAFRLILIAGILFGGLHYSISPGSRHSVKSGWHSN